MRQKKIVISWVKQVKKKSTKFSFLYQNVGVNKKKVTKILHQFTNYSREFSKINSRYLNILQNGVRKTHKKVCRNESVEIAGKNWFLKTTLTFWTLTNGSMRFGVTMGGGGNWEFKWNYWYERVGCLMKEVELWFFVFQLLGWVRYTKEKDIFFEGVI